MKLPLCDLRKAFVDYLKKNNAENKEKRHPDRRPRAPERRRQQARGRDDVEDVGTVKSWRASRRKLDVEELRNWRFHVGLTPRRSPSRIGVQVMLSLTLTCLLLTAAADPVEADHVIRGATLYDGTGQPGRKGDLAIKGDRIVAVGTFATAGKPKIIDGKGLIVAPGFIDLHTHSDISIFVPGSKIPITEPGTRATPTISRKASPPSSPATAASARSTWPTT